MEHLNECTVLLYDKTYQYDAYVVEETTKNNLYAGVINELKKAVAYRSNGEYWAIIKNPNDNSEIRISNFDGGYNVGMVFEGEFQWFKNPTLINPDYTLNKIARV